MMHSNRSVCLDAFVLRELIPKKNSTGMLCALAVNGPDRIPGLIRALGKSALDNDRYESS